MSFFSKLEIRIKTILIKKKKKHDLILKVWSFGSQRQDRTGQMKNHQMIVKYLRFSPEVLLQSLNTDKVTCMSSFTIQHLNIDVKYRVCSCSDLSYIVYRLTSACFDWESLISLPWQDCFFYLNTKWYRLKKTVTTFTQINALICQTIKSGPLFEEDGGGRYTIT